MLYGVSKMELKRKGSIESVLHRMVKEGIYENIEEARYETRLALRRRYRRI